MKKLILMAVSFIMIAAPATAAQSSGNIDIGGRFVDGDNTEKSAKFLEYRDLDDQLTTQLNVLLQDDRYYLDLSGGNLGYDDQSFSLSGSCYGHAKFKLFYDELTHNLSLDDSSMFAGVGTTALTISPSVTVNDASTWLPLDYSVDRKQIGAKLELTFDSPLFVVVDVTHTEKEGVIPWGVNIDSMTGGSDSLELPAPVDNTTTNMTVKAGYRTKALFAQADVSFSEFNNDKDRLSLPTTASPDFLAAQPGPVYFGPDNDMVQFGGQLILHDLPVNSVLALRASHSRLESDAQVAGTSDGELTYTKAAVSLRSKPTKALSTKLSYSFLQKDNKAASFLYNGNQTHIFEYRKNHLEMEAAYRLNSDNRLKAGYDFLNVDRSEMRFDAEETDEHTLFAEWKNTSLDMASIKLRYEHSMRSSDFNGASAVDTVADANTIIYAYIRPFDAADRDQDRIRIMFEASPVAYLDLGAEINASWADYDKTLIGRTDEQAQEFILDANIRLPMDATLYGYLAYEKSEVESQHIRWSSAAPIIVGVPVIDSAAAWNWSADRSDVTTSFGVKLNVPMMDDRLMLSAAWDYQENDGEVDFTAIQEALENVTSYDDYKKQTVNLKAEYDVTDNVALILGYIYEKYELDDLGYNNYFNISSNFDYLTGAYADMDYEANIGYATLSYRF